MVDVRTNLVARLKEDLIGPAAPDESILDRPSDRYLTGILFPRRLAFAAEEDETLNGGAETEESAGDDENTSPTGLHKPSSAGISFCLEVPSEQSLAVVVRVSGGTYRREQRKKVSSTTAEADDSSDRTRTVGGAIEWKRTPHDFQVPLKFGPSTVADVILTQYGLEGFSLFVTRAPIENGFMVTVRIVNGQEFRATDGRHPDEMSFFQTALGIRAEAPARLVARPPSNFVDDEDSKAAALLYRRHREFAVGHTCGATWDAEKEGAVEWVSTTWIPEQTVPIVSALGAPALRKAIKSAGDVAGLNPLAASHLASAGEQLPKMLGAVVHGYTTWIAERRVEAKSLAQSLQLQAKAHLSACEDALSRMRAGAKRIETDKDIRAAFVLMNQAMHVQRVWTERSKAAREGRTVTSELQGLHWYPFQLAFILLNIESIADPDSKGRSVMDLLWFPTGGGKTEAYLGLVAFGAFLRRIRRREQDDRGGGVSCIMRYTLRLLTLQQFQRAATLMVACEYLRLGNAAPPHSPDLTSAASFSVGLWIGGEATPNKLEDAIAALSNSFAPSSPKQLTSCPCCGGKLDWRAEDANTDIIVSCRNQSCDLARAIPKLPIRTVDELIYREAPTLLFATVDKFAQIVRNPATRSLFNTGTAPPPDLIVQDELHLISGPLGTLAGLYECAVDLICSAGGYKPKVVGSTATIRRANDQIRALFNRQSAQFPPPGLDIDDSCFSYVEQRPRTRAYAGITTAGRSAKFTLQAVYASLLQSSASIVDAKRRDGYHTLVGYFNALRELGGALVLSQDDVPASIKLIADRRGEETRHAREIVELTSRVSQHEIRRILDDLEVPCDQEGSVDLLLATNMISVGVDVPRLALMVVMGQPKGISEYIQATSRVGRDSSAGGLVLTVLNANKARDRAHFENFVGVHQALYREVEATSVTPFAARARDRALHAAVVAAARHLVQSLADNPSLDDRSAAAVGQLVAAIGERASIVDPDEAEATKAELNGIIKLWQQRSNVVETYWVDEKGAKSLLVSAEKAAASKRSGLSNAWPWPTLNSMRTVEAGTPLRLVEKLRDGEALRPAD